MKSDNLGKNILESEDEQSGVIELEDVQERGRNTTMVRIEKIKNFAVQKWESKISISLHLRSHMVLSKF